MELQRPLVAPRPDRASRARVGTKASGSRWFRSSTAATAAASLPLAEGLSEEIVTGLSRFSYLRVVARSSTSRDAARYVMEGSLRQAGSQLRVAVQLVDAVSGAHLWAETFDRPFQPDDIFTLQDELVPRIVSTVADQHGVLVHSMSAVIRGKGDTELNAHEAALCVFGFHERMTPEEHGRVRAILERAVKQAPDDSDCWAMLATVYTDEHMFGFNVRPDPLGRAQAAARRAVELSPTSALASQALAQSFFFRRELDACRPVAERTIALNPMDGAINAFIGLLLSLSGDWERGVRGGGGGEKAEPAFPGLVLARAGSSTRFTKVITARPSPLRSESISQATSGCPRPPRRHSANWAISWRRRTRSVSFWRSGLNSHRRRTPSSASGFSRICSRRISMACGKPD